VKWLTSRHFISIVSFVVIVGCHLAVNESFPDKPADNSDLFPMPIQHQLSLLSVTGLKWLCLWIPFMS